MHLQGHYVAPDRGRRRRTFAPGVPRRTPSVDPGEGGPILGSVCTGYGGLDLGVLAAFGGGRIAWCADPDPHIAEVLAARLLGVPNLGDLRHIDWAGVEPVDVLTAGFPCQDISAAGKRRGIEKGQHSGLWSDIVAGLRVLRPPLLVVENVAALRWHSRGLHRVLGDLAEAGYDAVWRSVRAADIGAATRRERLFLLGWRQSYPVSGMRPYVASGLLAGRGSAVADPEGLGHWYGRSQGWGGISSAVVAAGSSLDRSRDVPSDPTGDRRHQGLSGAAGFQRRSDAAFGSCALAGRRSRQGHLVAVPHAPGSPTPDHRQVDWGEYWPAVRRWEHVLGRPAPYPAEPGRHGRPVLAPVFVEWLQGLDPGWVTDLPLPRTAKLRALGNGVVPQQAAYAVALLLADLGDLLDRIVSQRQSRRTDGGAA